MRESILAAHEQGKPIYAECGGLMYLGSSLEMEAESYEMVGVFDGVSKMTTRLRKFGYCIAEPLEDTLLGKKGQLFAVMNFIILFLKRPNQHV